MKLSLASTNRYVRCPYCGRLLHVSSCNWKLKNNYGGIPHSRNLERTCTNCIDIESEIKRRLPYMTINYNSTGTKKIAVYFAWGELHEASRCK